MYVIGGWLVAGLGVVGAGVGVAGARETMVITQFIGGSYGYGTVEINTLPHFLTIDR